MNVKELINQLSNLKEELQNKEVLVIAKNGTRQPVNIKFQKKDSWCFDLTDENVDAIILTN